MHSIFQFDDNEFAECEEKYLGKLYVENIAWELLSNIYYIFINIDCDAILLLQLTIWIK